MYHGIDCEHIITAVTSWLVFVQTFLTPFSYTFLMQMVLCVNTSLGMGKGKIAAQCCHAAVGCYKRAKKNCPAAVRAWEMTGCAKIAVKCPSEDELETIMVAAHQRGLPMYFVADAGRTQIAAGSRTVLGLGPAPISAFEGVSDHLKLM